MPKKSKSITNIPAADAPAAVAAVLADSRFPALIIEARVSSLVPAGVNSDPILAVHPSTSATLPLAASVRFIMYFSGRRMMAYSGHRMNSGIMDQPQPPMGSLPQRFWISWSWPFTTFILIMLFLPFRFRGKRMILTTTVKSSRAMP